MLKRIGKTLFWFIIVFLFLFIGVFVALQFHANQFFAIKQIESYLQSKLKTKVQIGDMHLSFLKYLILEDILIEDLQKDTILYCHKLEINFDVRKLLDKEFKIKSIKIDKIYSHIYKSLPDSSFNFDFITKSFASPDTQKVVAPLPAKNYPSAKSWNVNDMEKIEIEKVNFVYHDAVSGLAANYVMDNLSVIFDNFDMGKNKIHLKKIEIQDVSSAIKLGKSTESKPDTSSTKIDYDFKLDEFSLKNMHFAIVDTIGNSNITINLPHFVVHPGKIDLKNSDITIKDILFDQTAVNYAQFKVSKQKTTNKVLPKQETKNDEPIQSKPSSWKIKINQVRFNKNVIVYDDYNSPPQKSKIDPSHLFFNEISSTIENISYSANLATIDLKSFHLTEKKGFVLNNIKTEIVLEPKNLNVKNLFIQSGKNIVNANIKSKFSDISKIDKGSFDIVINKIELNWKEIKTYLPDSLVPPTINVTEQMFLSGDIKGKMSDATVNVNFKSAFGNVTLQSQLTNITNSATAKYVAQINIDDLQVGRIANIDTSTTLTMVTNIDGTSLNFEKMIAEIKFDIKKLHYNNYLFTDLVFTSNLQNKNVSSHGFMVDDNLEFDLRTAVDLSKKVPQANLYFNLQKINLKQLHLYADDLRLKGEINTQFTGGGLDSMDVLVDLSKMYIGNAKDSFPANAKIELSSKNKSLGLSLKSNIADFYMEGPVVLSEFSNVMQQYVNKYLTVKDSLVAKNYDYCNFEYSLDVKNIDLVKGLFVPGLSKLNFGKCSGNFDMKTHNFTLNLTVPQIIYSGITIDNFNMDINSDSLKLKTALAIDSVHSASFTLPKIVVNTTIKENSIFPDVIIYNINNDENIAFKGKLNLLKDAIRYSLNDSGMVLSKDIWLANAGNYIEYSKSKIIANNFTLVDGDQKISLITNFPDGQESITKFLLENFNCESISYILIDMLPNTNIPSLGGFLSGSIDLYDFPAKTKFNNDMKISDFRFAMRRLGDIGLKASNLIIPDRYDLDFSLNGADDNFKVAGYYSTSAKVDPISIDVDVAKLDISKFTYWLEGILQDMTGSMNGSLKIRGTSDAPKITGKLHCNQTNFTVVPLKAKLLFNNEDVFFTDDGIHFNAFTITDVNKNKAVLNGSLLTKNFTDYKLNLTLKGDNMTMLNSTAADNDVYFGKLIVGSEIKISGTSALPVVDATIKIKKGTDLTYRMTNQRSIDVGDGVVEFTNIGQDLSLQEALDSIQTKLTGMELKSNIEVENGSKFKIILDSYTGDEITISANAQLSFALSATGIMTLIGKCEIDDGLYYMPQFDKKFTIDQGSNLTWAGDPYNPYMKMTAKYTVNSAPMNLISESLATMDDSQKKIAKKQIPFIVTMNLEGDLGSAKMDFGVSLPEDQQGVLNGDVNNKLQKISTDVAEVNKQAISLLVIGSFIPEGSAQGGGFNTSDYTYSLVSQQLNAFAEKYVKFVDMNFDLQAYDDYGKNGEDEIRKDLKFQIGKRFFDDRLNFQLGGVFILQGTESVESQKNKSAPSVVILYKLTKDGRYSIKAFQDNKYTGLLEGQIVEQGVSVMFTKDYDKMIEFFRKPEEVKLQENQ